MAVPVAYAGNIDSPAAPSADASRMYTLEEIYDKVNDGTDPAAPSGAFNEPAAGPASTMYTLNEIEGKIAAGTTDATAGDVLSGKTFISRTAGSGESVVTGSMSTETLSDANDTVSAGYYAATTLSAVDLDLATGNIKSGTTIFGFAGDANVVDTSSGDAVAGEILSTKVAWVDGSEVTGSMPDKEGDNASTAQAAAASVNYLTAPTGYYDGDDRVSATDAQVAALDADITAGNIKDTIDIFGVTGTYTGGGTYGIPKTGQETQYRAGDDADYADPAEEDVGYTRGEGTWGGWNADGGHFTDNGDGTITDNATGLVWASDGNGAGCNSGATLTWNSAIDWAEGLTFASETDWRLPNVKELISIIDYGSFEPAIDTTFFPNTKLDVYWSSTTYASFTDGAYRVDFNYGNLDANIKTGSFYVRAVRGGQ